MPQNKLSNLILISDVSKPETFKKHIESEISAANRLMSAGLPLVVVHNKRVGINQGAKAKQYWSSVIMGRAAPRAGKPVDPTVWKAEMFGHEPVMGKKNALVTVMAFMEFQ